MYRTCSINLLDLITLAGLVLGVVVALNVETLRAFFSRMTNTNLFPAEFYFLSRLPAIVDARERLAFFHLVALDHRQVHDPARYPTRHRHHFTVDARIVDINVRKALINPISARYEQHCGKQRDEFGFVA